MCCECFGSDVTSREQLVADLKKVIEDAEEILRETAGVAGEKMAALRERVAGHLGDAKIHLEAIECQLVDKTRAAARAADEFVNESPWQAVGIAAGVGALLGILISRR